MIIDHLDNLKNAEMNNIGTIDHAVRDWIDDSDYLLGRIVTEFPRLAGNFKSKFDFKTKPWGQKKDPIFIDPYLDENQLNLCL